MINYRKRQIVKIYRYCRSQGTLIIIEPIDRLMNRAYCSILNHLKSEEEVLETLKRR